MWLISGPFDGTQTGDEEPLKTKLLKTNHVYDVGRHQGSPLCINNKKISRQNGQFIVGEHSEDDVSHGAMVPTLSLRNNKTTALKVSRGDSALLVNPDSMRELQSGDVVYLTGAISVIVIWESVVCFHAQNDPDTVDLAACASLGIKVVTKHSHNVTHHLAPALTTPLTPAMLYALLAPAWFVTPEWLVEFIRRGTDNDHGLEKTYNRPIESGFRPERDSALAERYPAMAKMAAWNPNDDRKALFEDMRFVFVIMGSGAGTESKAMTDVVLKAGATRQLVDIEKEVEAQAKGSTGAWGSVLKKRKVVLKEKMRSGLVLVGEEETMTARGIPKEIRNAWEAMVFDAKNVNMRIIHPSLIAEAIIGANVSVLDCVLEDVPKSKSVGESASRALPDHVPSTHPEEPSQLGPPQTRQASVAASQTSDAGPSRRLTRRAVSRTPVPEPVPPTMPMAVEEESAVSLPPRKLLKRRAKTANVGGIVNELLGIDESTVELDGSQAESRSEHQAQTQEHVLPPSLQKVVPPTPIRPGRLKRRAGTATVSSQLFPDLPTADDGAEPPLKKFKALFEQSGQGKTDQPDEVSGSQLQAVQEEEESSQSLKQTRTHATKRKASTMEEDVEMAEAEGSTRHKRRAVETVDAVEPSQLLKPPSSRKPNSVAAKQIANDKKPKSEMAKGAAPGKPDTDPSFLLAIASTKRGKKTEDDFDREFNKLRIARPDINNTKDTSDGRSIQWGKEWDGLDDFERDVGLRGNFMQIVEMDVWRDSHRTRDPGHNVRREEGLGARMDWDGREDFKKFRRKTNLQPRAPVQLVVNESQENAPGPSYWDGKRDKGPRGFDDMSQSQENDTSQPTLKSQRKPRPKSKVQIDISEDQEDDEVEEAISAVTPKGKAKMSRTRTRKVQPLFNPVSDDDWEDNGVGTGATFRGDDEDPDLTLRSPEEKPRGKKQRAAVPEESDSEDGMNFGGFAKRAKRLKR